MTHRLRLQVNPINGFRIFSWHTPEHLYRAWQEAHPRHSPAALIDLNVLSFHFHPGVSAIQVHAL